MKLKEAAVGSIISPTDAWSLFRMPGGDDTPVPDRLEVVEHIGEAVLCRPIGGGTWSVYFHNELPCIPG